MDTACLGMPSIDCDLVELDITELSEANRRWSHGPMLSSFATMTVHDNIQIELHDDSGNAARLPRYL